MTNRLMIAAFSTSLALALPLAGCAPERSVPGGVNNDLGGPAGDPAPQDGEAHAPDGAEPVQAALPPPADVPEGLAPSSEGGPLFEVDTSTETFELPPLDGGHVLQGVLADDLGRRELRFVDAATGQAEVLAPAGWNLPPVASHAAAGTSVMACFNQLIGRPSANTTGELPDPTQGVHLRCRARADGGGWGEPFRIGRPFRAAWLQAVEADGDGWTVRYYVDDGWFVGPAVRGHGVYEQAVSAAGAAGDPTLLEVAGELEDPPIEPGPDGPDTP